jgi:DNA-binding MarR family transcriptional regulator
MTSTKQSEEGNAHETAHEQGSERGALIGSSGFLLARLGAESRRQFAQLLERHSLSMHHFAVLLALGESDSLPQHKIGALVGVDPRNVVGIIDDLETQRLVAREVDPADRRRHRICLTREGRRKMNTLRVAGAELEEGMLEPLSHAEREQLHRLLVKLFVALT